MAVNRARPGRAESTEGPRRDSGRRTQPGWRSASLSSEGEAGCRAERVSSWALGRLRAAHSRLAWSAAVTRSPARGDRHVGALRRPGVDLTWARDPEVRVAPGLEPLGDPARQAADREHHGEPVD